MNWISHRRNSFTAAKILLLLENVICLIASLIAICNFPSNYMLCPMDEIIVFMTSFSFLGELVFCVARYNERHELVER